MMRPAHAREFQPSYGRRRGHKLRPNRQALFDTLLPQISVALPKNAGLDPASLFPQAKEYWLEIGFGGGEHLAHQAELHPEAGIIGCEPYVNGMAALLSRIKEKNLTNIRVFSDDARLLIKHLPDASLSRVFILYPDPWPKARHHKRRLVSKPFLDALSRVMKPGAILQLATDDEDYGTWMLEQLLPHPAFEWRAETATDWTSPPQDWVSTRYEQKALKDKRKPVYLMFLKAPLANI